MKPPNETLQTYQVLQDIDAGSKKDLPADLDDRSANEARFRQHHFCHFIVGQFFSSHAQLLKAGASEIKHFGRGLSLQQLLNFNISKGIFKKIPLDNFQFILRKELSRLAAGCSPAPTVKKHFHPWSRLR